MCPGALQKYMDQRRRRSSPRAPPGYLRSAGSPTPMQWACESSPVLQSYTCSCRPCIGSVDPAQCCRVTPAPGSGGTCKQSHTTTAGSAGAGRTTHLRQYTRCRAVRPVQYRALRSTQPPRCSRGRPRPGRARRSGCTLMPAHRLRCQWRAPGCRPQLRRLPPRLLPPSAALLGRWGPAGAPCPPCRA